MDSNWAAEHLQVIRTLMERSALYRRALAPIMIYSGALGVAGGVGGWLLRMESPQAFTAYWAAVGLAALAGSFFLVRRQAIHDSEPFWSPPTRRVAQALAPPLFIGALAGVLVLVRPTGGLLPALALPAVWMLFYGCALSAAGFFMQRGIKLLGWLFILCGCAIMAAGCLCGTSCALSEGHLLMGGVFGGLHLAYGLYLYFTETHRNEA